MKTLLLSSLFLFYSFVGFSQLFGPQQEITESASGAWEVHSADLDGDGGLDVISVSVFDDKIVWYENDGVGNFGPQRVITESQGAVSIYTADLDGDGDLDVLSASMEEDKITWYENDGVGNFGPQQILTSNADAANSVYASDLDADGDVDVLSASSGDDKIAWYENDGAGNFGEQQIITTDADGASSVYASDLDGDGDLDVLSASFDDDKIAWYENNGFGDFGSQEVITTDANGANSIYASDLDGDGDLDILSASSYDATIAWYENDGAGDFYSQQIISTSAEGAYYVSASDLDVDGDLDVISADSSGATKIVWFENDGTGTFGEQQLISPSAEFAYSVYASDLDGDGDLEIITGSFFYSYIAWYENDGTGTFGGQQLISPNADGANSVYVSDLDGDGDLDVLSASFSDNKIACYENEGMGVFGPQQILTTNAEAASSVYSSDLDGDGDVDVLSASFDDDKIAWYKNDGTGNFGDEEIITFNANGANSVYTSDLDGDGDLDVLSASSYDNKISWYENDGAGNFGVQLIISLEAEGARVVCSSDLDGDGDLDVLSASSDDDKIAWYENDGTGTFGTQQIITTSADVASSVYASDLDGDGDLDVLSASFGDDKLAWYENDGLGNFGEQAIITTDADGAHSVYSSDVDGDGDFDVLYASRSDHKIAWYENDGTGSFGSQQVISPSVFGARSVYSSDLDGDGDFEVLSASSIDSKIAWYENLTGEGCMDSEACNFDSEAWIDSESCCFNCGCTHELATNYDQNHCFDNGSCLFKLTGTVFYDENENGIMDGEEYGLPFQTVVLDALGLTYITNDQGGFIANIGSEQFVELELQENLVFPYNTTPNPAIYDAETAESTQIDFGISNEELSFAICIDLYPDGNGFLCNDFVNHNICYRNMGNLPIDGIIELEYDSLFQGHQEVTEIDSVDGNTVYMSFENLLPGEMFFYDIELLTPTVDNIGEFVTSVAKVYGFYEGDQVAYGEQELTMEITCAYDPNDKQAFPLGYTEEHWLLPETEQEFLVRFQNTGNAPAQDVRIQDSIDVNYDLSTFRMVANSHSVMTSINEETRVIDFFFQDIQLPDSVNNEPDSHGLVSYAITPLADLPVGTELNNTAFIYFDNNEAIVTNTTWTTIHECGGEAAFEATVTEVCAGESIDFTSTYEQVETHLWNVDAAPENAEAAFSKTFTESGEYIIQLVAENPLCSASSMQMITVYDLPTVEFTQEGDLLTASEGESYQWLLNGEEIEGAIAQEYSVSEDGTYSVEVMNENNCTVESEGIMIVGISELESETILLYPNPMTDRAYLEFEDASQRTITLLDANGKVERVWNNIATQRLEIQKGDLAAGNYVIQVLDGSGSQYVQLVIR